MTDLFSSSKAMKVAALLALALCQTASAFDASPISAFTYKGQTVLEAKIVAVTPLTNVIVAGKVGKKKERITIPWGEAVKDAQLKSRLSEEIAAIARGELPSPAPASPTPSPEQINLLEAYLANGTEKKVGRWDGSEGSLAFSVSRRESGQLEAVIFASDKQATKTIQFTLSRAELEKLQTMVAASLKKMDDAETARQSQTSQ